MKRAFTILGGLLLSAGLMQSCTIEDDSVEQHIYTSEVFEVTVDFTASNNYSQLFTFNQPSYEGDMVLMYVLWEQDNGADVWRLVPQTAYFDDGGLVEYNYDFSRYNFSVMLSTNYNSIPGDIYNAYFLGQVFRAIVVPGNVVNSTSSMSTKGTAVDFSDYDATMKHFGLSEQNIKKLN